jgi:hypothetical protein
MMLRITYVSAESKQLTADDLLAILVQCNKNNPENRITGMLIYGNGTFLQTLEGPNDAVKALSNKISKDLRHKDFQILSETIVSERAHHTFSMGFEQLTEQNTGKHPPKKRIALEEFNPKFLSENQGLVESLVNMHGSRHWDPLVQEVNAKDEIISALRESLSKKTYQSEVMSLVLESLIIRIESGNLDPSRTNFYRSILNSVSNIGTDGKLSKLPRL